MLSQLSLIFKIMIILFAIGICLTVYSIYGIYNKRNNLFLLLFSGIIISTLSVPLIINEFYKLGANTGIQYEYVTLWQAKDVLSFYGTFLAFLGTVALGAIALWQNKNIYNGNEEHERIRLAKENYVLFDFSNFNAEYYYISASGDYLIRAKAREIENGFNGKKAIIMYDAINMNESKLKLVFDIINIGKFPAVNIRITDSYDNQVEDSNILHGERRENLDVENDKKYIVNGCRGVAVLNIDLNCLVSKKTLNYKLKFQNPFGDEFSQSISIKLSNKDEIIEFDLQCTLELN